MKSFLGDDVVVDTLPDIHQCLSHLILMRSLSPAHVPLANRTVHPTKSCFELPDNLNLEKREMCELWVSALVPAATTAPSAPEEKNQKDISGNEEN